MSDISKSPTVVARSSFKFLGRALGGPLAPFWGRLSYSILVDSKNRVAQSPPQIFSLAGRDKVWESLGGGYDRKESNYKFTSQIDSRLVCPVTKARYLMTNPKPNILKRMPTMPPLNHYSKPIP